MFVNFNLDQESHHFYLLIISLLVKEQNFSYHINVLKCLHCFQYPFNRFRFLYN